MAAGHSVGTIFAEVDLDFTPYTKAQKRLLQDATSTTLNIEKSYKDLGIRSAKEFDLMRAKIQNAYERITRDAKTSAADITRAEQAKNDQLRRLNDQQFGHQTSLIESMKKNWLAMTAAVYAATRMAGAAWDEMGKAADFKERVNALDALGAKYNLTGRQIVDSMKEASRGLISMAEAGDMAASALNLSLSPQQMIEFTRVSEQLSDVIGGSIPEAFNRLTVAAASGRTQTLAQMGIIIDLEREYKKYGDSLTEVQKQQIRLNVIKEAAIAKVAELGGAVDTERDKMDRMVKTSKDIKLAFYSIGATIVATVLPALTGWAEGIRAIVFEWNRLLEGPTSKDILAKQASDLEARIRAYEWHLSPKNPLRDQSGYAQQQLDMLRKQLAVVQGSLKNEAAGVYTPKYTGTKLPPSAVMPAMPQTPELSSKDLEKSLWSETQEFNAAAVTPSQMDIFLLGNAQRLAEMEASARTTEMKALTESASYKQAVLQSEHTQALALIDERTQAAVEAELKIMEKTDKLAGDKANAYKTMYRDMKDETRAYYDYQLEALNQQREQYEKLVGKNAVTDAWYARQKKSLDQQLTLSSNDFIGGVIVGYEKMIDSATTFADVGKSTFESFTDSTSDMLSDNFFALFTGRMDDLELDWSRMWDAMARTAADKVADIATEKAIDVAVSGVDWLGTAMGWWAAGAWDIKRDQVAVLHKGEMVIPATEAQGIREAAPELGTGWGVAAPKGSFAAEMSKAVSDKAIAQVRGFAESKIVGLLATGKFALGVNPLGVFGSFAQLMAAAIMSTIEAMNRFSVIYGPETPFDPSMSAMRTAMPYGPIALTDIKENLAMWGLTPEEISSTLAGLGTTNAFAGFSGSIGAMGGGDTGGYGGGMGTDPGDPEGGGPGVGGSVAHRGGRFNLRSDEGFLIAQKGEEVISRDNIKRLEKIVAAASSGTRSGGPLVYIGGNLIADRQTFDDFVEKIDYTLNKRGKRTYQ